MNFYYDTILGLQYDYIGDLFIIDIEMLPQDIRFDIEKLEQYLKQSSFQLMDSIPSIQIIPNITNYKL